MKTLRVMGVIGIILSALSFMCLVAYNNIYDYEVAVGWGVYSTLYLLAYSIVGFVQAKKNENENEK